MTRRLALVGLGTWAEQGHLPVYLGPVLSPHLEVVALCSRDIAKAQQWCDRFGIARAFDDFTHMLVTARPELVAVTTPDSAHTHYVVTALEHGCDVLVEKPLATSLEDCERILRAADKAARKVITLFHKRADPLWHEARQRILSGQYGALQMGVASIQNPLSVPAGGYFSSPLASSSDPNWFLGTHFYDLLRYMTGLDPVKVSASSYRKVLPEQGVDTLDAVKADIFFGDGGKEPLASVSVMLSWNLPNPSIALTKQAMQLHFEYGELDLDGTRRGFSEYGQGQYREVNPYFMQQTGSRLTGYGAGFLEEATLSLVLDGYETSVPMPDLGDAWWASALAQAVEDSCDQRQEVIVRKPPASQLK